MNPLVSSKNGYASYMLSRAPLLLPGCFSVLSVRCSAHWTTAAPNSNSGTVTGVVVDATGNPIAGAQITSGSGDLLATTGADGKFTLPAGAGTVAIQASHFAPASVTIAGQPTLRIQLEQPFENVTVTAYRSPLSSLDSPASTRVMTAEALRHAASLPLDDKLRTVPGFELFRRSSSLVANPTSQGVSLRGLGSTSASRSLVVFDEVPLNDPYGGWIHWEELPELDIQSVEVVRGGASDLYGSSAIGGVISVEPVRPKNSTLRFTSSGGSESTVDGALLGSLTLGKWSGLVTGGAVATDGYILIAPAYRGPIDQPSNVHAQNALVQIDRDLGNSQRLFLRGNVLNEARHNGTPIQNNGTRLWRYDGGADLTDFLVRVYGTAEHYRQRFTSINATRTAETLTTSAEEPSDELGVAGHWHHADRHEPAAARRGGHPLHPRGELSDDLHRQRRCIQHRRQAACRLESMARCCTPRRIGRSAAQRGSITSPTTT